VFTCAGLMLTLCHLPSYLCWGRQYPTQLHCVHYPVAHDCRLPLGTGGGSVLCGAMWSYVEPCIVWHVELGTASGQMGALRERVLPVLASYHHGTTGRWPALSPPDTPRGVSGGCGAAAVNITAVFLLPLRRKPTAYALVTPLYLFCCLL
jgi:hypothetical protein